MKIIFILIWHAKLPSLRNAGQLSFQESVHNDLQEVAEKGFPRQERTWSSCVLHQLHQTL